MSDVLPTAITRREDRGIEITWSDGSVSILAAGVLRAACPCASCRERRRAEEPPAAGPPKLPVLGAGEARPLEITRMRPVGNYAYNIAFSDGHDSGIYSFELLRELGGERSPPDGSRSGGDL